MHDNNIYIVETKGGALRQLVAAPSASSAKAVVARDIITVRRARPIELLGVDPATVIDASKPAAIEPADEQEGAEA